jgi:hypothetical protein
MNYAPTCFGTSVPEVVDIKENDDGTTTLTVNAVCEMVMNDGINRIPDYQYRIRVSDD